METPFGSYTTRTEIEQSAMYFNNALEGIMLYGGISLAIYIGVAFVTANWIYVKNKGNFSKFDYGDVFTWPLAFIYYIFISIRYLVKNVFFAPGMAINKINNFIESLNQRCYNCKTKIKGQFCSNCGEAYIARLDKKDSIRVSEPEPYGKGRA